VTLKNCRDCIFSGNILQDCQTGRHQYPEAPQLQREALLEITDCRNITISNCQILDSAPYGIRLHNAVEMTLLGLSIADRRTPPLQKNAIHWTGESSDSLITACRFAGCSVEPMQSIFRP
jgi:hypothetical protein